MEPAQLDGFRGGTRLVIMAKWCALFFGALGYVLVIWYYSVAFAPLTWESARYVLWHACVACTAVSGLHSRILRGAFLFLGPINAIIYAMVGFFIGKLILALKKAGWTVFGS